MNTKILLAIFAVALLSFSFAAAAPGGASTTPGASSATNTGASVTTVDVEGGNVTYVDVSATVATSRWGGFYGNISGNVMLGDASSNVFYQWTVGDMTGAVVYATNASITDWTSGNIGPLAAANTPSYLQTTATDNYTNTFSANELFTSASLSEASTPYAATWNSTAQGDLKTYALYSTADDATIWAGKSIAGSDAFNGGSTVDYQILLPAQSTTTYSFYLELP